MNFESIEYRKCQISKVSNFKSRKFRKCRISKVSNFESVKFVIVGIHSQPSTATFEMRFIQKCYFKNNFTEEEEWMKKTELK